jgi:hypothetical protein
LCARERRTAGHQQKIASGADDLLTDWPPFAWTFPQKLLSVHRILFHPRSGKAGPVCQKSTKPIAANTVLKKSFQPGKSLRLGRFVPPRSKNSAERLTKFSPPIGPTHGTNPSVGSSRTTRTRRPTVERPRMAIVSFFNPRTGRGVWYRFDKRLSGVGIISEKSIQILTELVK